MDLYLVTDGTAYLATPDTLIEDETIGVMAIAESEADALALGAAYDAGRIQPDNQIIDGRTVAALISHTTKY